MAHALYCFTWWQAECDFGLYNGYFLRENLGGDPKTIFGDQLRQSNTTTDSKP